MHPFLSDLRLLFWYVLGWLGAGAAFAVLLRWLGVADMPGAALFALPLCLVFGFVALSAYYVCRAMPYGRRRPLGVLSLFGCASLACGAAWLLLALLWNGAAGQVVAAGAGLVRLDAGAGMLVFLAGAGGYLLSLLAHDVSIAFAHARAASERAVAMRELAREAELRMLRSQIDPHFLFNSLNSICALIGFDPDGARAMTIDLGEFFRRTLALSGRERIALREEIALCEHFLAIEKRRFGSKLEVAWAVDGAALGCLLPPLCLQPLIENAMKHGIRHLSAGGTVRVRADVRDGWLHLAVDNPVEPGVPGGDGEGLGLNTLRERLTLLYEARARLQWGLTENVFLVEMVLPREEVTAS
jgi:two-component system, LytTR family, sensor histidine kinase AlgZ